MEPTNLTCWPDRLQEILLRATILRGEEAVSAWEAWAAETDIDTVDEGSARLLPETYTNLKSFGVDHESFGVIRGIKRRTWLQNQLLFHQATAAIEILHDRGIETMVTKGPALVLRHYHDLGRRPMADFDIVVHKEDGKRAVEALVENGYRLTETAENLQLVHAASYVNETGRQFDLHWQVLPGCTDSRPFWDLATPVSLDETNTLAPSSTDLLFHVCIHGLRLNQVAPLRWVVDATMIIRSADIDWDRLVDLSKRYWLGYRMREALRYLRQFDVEVPEIVLASLSKGSVFGLQKSEFELITGRRPKSRSTQIAVLWLGFKRYAGREPGLDLSKLPDYLKRAWGIKNFWSLPWAVIRKSARRLFLNPTG